LVFRATRPPTEVTFPGDHVDPFPLRSVGHQPWGWRERTPRHREEAV